MIRAEKRRHIMNLLDQFEVLEIDKNMLTDKKQQTDYKIKYVSEYAKLWSIISTERNDVTEITFIDCMCNAGVYRDGDCCTAIEVFSLFKEAARLHKNKTYNLYLNDIDSNRISCINKVIQYLNDDVVENLKVYTNNMDVNVYLERLATNDNIFGYGKSVVLYIDPFDFGTVNIPIVSKVLKNNYCEVIFNFFISDYVRNIKKDKNRIRACINNGNVETKEDIINYMRKSLSVGKIQYFFAYQFKTITNVELYQIIFVSPNIRGLEKLKEVLWKVFDGKEFHRNQVETAQMSLFTEEDETQMRLDSYAYEAKELLCFNMTEKEMSYEEIEVLLIENTMLMQSHIINNVLKPLIKEGKIKKMGRVSARNFKADTYKRGF